MNLVIGIAIEADTEDLCKRNELASDGGIFFVANLHSFVQELKEVARALVNGHVCVGRLLRDNIHF